MQKILQLPIPSEYFKSPAVTKIALLPDNDSNSLRIDPAMKMAIGRLPETGLDLASQPTFSRLENMITRRDLCQIAKGLVDHFLASYTEPPEVIVLDFDDTEDVVRGHQQLALFSGYYQSTSACVRRLSLIHI